MGGKQKSIASLVDVFGDLMTFSNTMRHRKAVYHLKIYDEDTRSSAKIRSTQYPNFLNHSHLIKNRNEMERIDHMQYFSQIDSVWCSFLVCCVFLFIKAKGKSLWTTCIKPHRKCTK